MVIVVLVVGFPAYCRRWQVVWVGLGTPLQVMDRAGDGRGDGDTEGLSLVAECCCDLRSFSIASVVGCQRAV